MSAHVLRGATVYLSSVDLSDHTEAVELSVAVQTVDVTPLASSWKQYATARRTWGVRLRLFQDYDSSSVYQTVQAALTGSTATSIYIKPTTATPSVTNPALQGSVVFEGDALLVGGPFGAAHRTEVVLRGASDLLFRLWSSEEPTGSAVVTLTSTPMAIYGALTSDDVGINLLNNEASNTAYLGDADVTTSNGYPVGAQASFALRLYAAHEQAADVLYGKAAAGQTVELRCLLDRGLTTETT